MNERSFPSERNAPRKTRRTAKRPAARTLVRRPGRPPRTDGAKRVRLPEAHASATTTPSREPRAPRQSKAPRESTARADHRDRILRASEELFAKRGFHGTSLRDVAQLAKVSLGNIYNHFETKEQLFSVLLDELERRYLDPEQPLTKALVSCDFPADLEKLGRASRETVERFATYIRLIYVDVLEFQGEHVARLYGSMKKRYEAAFAERFAKLEKAGVLSEADPLIAVMMATILYMYYFTVERLFGVKRHYGLDDEQVIREFAKVLRLGILKR